MLSGWGVGVCVALQVREKSRDQCKMMSLRSTALVFLLAVAVANVAGACTGSATYKVVNECVWSSKTHPTDYPAATAHWSPLCGTSHSDAWSMYAVGEVTTVDGVKEVAETGSCNALEASIDKCVAEGTCTDMVKWPCSKFSGTCDHSGSMVVDAERSLVSLITMVAPSPDWMVGVSGIQLCEDGAWKKEYTADLPAIDAGTDSGTTFASPNSPTTPWEPVTSFDALDSSNIFWNPNEEVLFKVCTITFTLE